MRGAMMRGITLSESQERAMRAIRVKHISSMKPLQIEMITARADAEIAQLNGDQKGLDAANGRLTSSREQMQKLMKDRSPTTDLRGILTPDQQKTLDKNLSDGAQRRTSMRGMQGMRGMRGPGGMEGYRQAEPRRGFSPREGRRPGMMPRRFDENDANKDSTDDSTDHVRQNP